jgi:hypothetical protein
MIDDSPRRGPGRPRRIEPEVEKAIYAVTDRFFAVATQPYLNPTDIVTAAFEVVLGVARALPGSQTEDMEKHVVKCSDDVKWRISVLSHYVPAQPAVEKRRGPGRPRKVVD